MLKDDVQMVQRFGWYGWLIRYKRQCRYEPAMQYQEKVWRAYNRTPKRLAQRALVALLEALS